MDVRLREVPNFGARQTSEQNNHAQDKRASKTKTRERVSCDSRREESAGIRLSVAEAKNYS